MPSLTRSGAMFPSQQTFPGDLPAGTEIENVRQCPLVIESRASNAPFAFADLPRGRLQGHIIRHPARSCNLSGLNASGIGVIMDV